jgi:hypothetical protein
MKCDNGGVGLLARSALAGSVITEAHDYWQGVCWQITQ